MSLDAELSMELSRTPAELGMDTEMDTDTALELVTGFGYRHWTWIPGDACTDTDLRWF